MTSRKRAVLSGFQVGQQGGIRGVEQTRCMHGCGQTQQLFRVFFREQEAIGRARGHQQMLLLVAECLDRDQLHGEPSDLAAIGFKRADP